MVDYHMFIHVEMIGRHLHLETGALSKVRDRGQDLNVIKGSWRTEIHAARGQYREKGAICKKSGTLRIHA